MDTIPPLLLKEFNDLYEKNIKKKFKPNNSTHSKFKIILNTTKKLKRDTICNISTIKFD